MVLSDLSLEISSATINGIVGLNGAGKTTLLNAIYGLIKFETGSIKVDSEFISKRQIAFLETENYFYPGITGREHLEIFSNKKFDTAKWNKVFNLPLEGLIDEYSTGMRKKLAIMALLKLEKPVMILDEPFNGLDLETCRSIRSILLGLKDEGRTIIVTSHILETLTNMCDYIHYLESGKILYSRGSSDFSKLEEEIFGYIETKNEGIIREAMQKEKG